MLVGGINAAAFLAMPREVWKVMEYLGSPEFANDRQAAQTARVGGGNSGFLTGNKNADTTAWRRARAGLLGDPGDRQSRRRSTHPIRCRPTSVRGSFWTRDTSFVNGDEDAATAAANIEASSRTEPFRPAAFDRRAVDAHVMAPGTLLAEGGRRHQALEQG